MSSGTDQEIDPASKLCLECGLCCDGSIFSHVELNKHDCDKLDIEFEEGKRLTFPCEHLHRKRCTIYQKRPTVCASYRCKTLAALETGKMAFSEAQEIIHKAAKLGREFEAAIPPGMTRKQAIICVVKDRCPQEASYDEFLRLRLAYVALQAMVDRHMRRKGEVIVRSGMLGG